MNTFISFPRFIKREPREEAVSPQRIAIGSVAISFDSRNPDAPLYNTHETTKTRTTMPVLSSFPIEEGAIEREARVKVDTIRGSVDKVK